MRRQSECHLFCSHLLRDCREDLHHDPVHFIITALARSCDSCTHAKIQLTQDRSHVRLERKRTVLDVDLPSSLKRTILRTLGRPNCDLFELHALVSCDMIRVFVDEQNISRSFNIPLAATWPNSRFPGEPLPTTSVNFSWRSMSLRQS